MDHYNFAANDTKNKTTEEEIWKNIDDFPFYEVSDLGRVRSWKTRGKTRQIPYILKQYINNNGYPTVHLVNKNNKAITINTHQVVIKAFRGHAPKSYECGHRDGNPQNNHISNLEWITHKENGADMVRHKRVPSGTKSHLAKFTDQDVIKIRKLYDTGEYLQITLAKMYDVSKSTMRKIVRRMSWVHI